MTDNEFIIVVGTCIVVFCLVCNFHKLFKDEGDENNDGR